MTPTIGRIKKGPSAASTWTMALFVFQIVSGASMFTRKAKRRPDRDPLDAKTGRQCGGVWGCEAVGWCGKGSH